MWWQQEIALTFLTDSSLALCSARVLIPTGSMRRYLLPDQVAQVVQIFKGGASTRVVTRRFAVSVSTV